MGFNYFFRPATFLLAFSYLFFNKKKAQDIYLSALVLVGG